MQNKKIVLIVLGIFFGFKMQSQKFTYDLSFNLGTSSFQTDYGVRGDIQSGVTGNMGFAAGTTLFVNFNSGSGLWSDKSDWFTSHFRGRLDLSYMKAELNHFGEGIDKVPKLVAMHGTSSVFIIGTGLEYHFNDLNVFRYRRDKLFDPYFDFGIGVVFSKPTLVSDSGDYKTEPNVLLPIYNSNTIFTESNTVFSLNFGLETRIRAGESGDFLIESKWHYFMSDKIDGIDTNIEADKFNDWMFNLGLGYVFYLN
jgi:hypothetical protein